MASNRTTIVKETATPAADATVTAAPQLARRLGLFDTTMLVMGGIIGSSIFIIPATIAQLVHSPALIFTAWMLGGLNALFGAFIYAELAARMPQVGGQYAYLREAYHPLIAFSYGWALLLILQTGAMASVAVIFARYLKAVSAVPLPDGVVTTVTIGLITIINCFGVRLGSTVQNVFMTLKILTFVMLIACGLFLSGGARQALGNVFDVPLSLDLLTGFGSAMVLITFSYGGSHYATFIAGEIREPEKNLPRGLILGVSGVVALYLLANFVYVWVLGTEQLPRTATPASDVMRIVLGERGAALLGAGIIISALGYLSHATLASPRVYYAMARDGLFFQSVAHIHSRTRVPILAIALQGIVAIAIALSGRYEQILRYVMSVQLIFSGLTTFSIFIFRKRAHGTNPAAFAVPGHPYTTALVIAWLVAVLASSIYKHPGNSVIGLAILLTGLPAYFLWRRRNL